MANNYYPSGSRNNYKNDMDGEMIGRRMWKDKNPINSTGYYADTFVLSEADPRNQPDPNLWVDAHQSEDDFEPVIVRTTDEDREFTRRAFNAGVYSCGGIYSPENELRESDFNTWYEEQNQE